MSGNNGRWLCAAVLAVTAVMAGTSGAQADSTPQGKELVILGDSFTANGWDPLSQDTKKCQHGDTAWPAQLQAQLGLQGDDQVWNQSCPGASIDTGNGYILKVQASNADKAGAFGPKTKLVTLQFGLNDVWGDSSKSPWDSMQNCFYDPAGGCGPDAVADGRMADPKNVTGPEYAARIAKVVAYVRYYAPNARIVIVGYPELFSPGQDAICFDIAGVEIGQPRGRTVVDYLDRFDLAQREAAALLHIEYLDSRSLTRGHGLCTPDQWVNGVFDPKVNVAGLPFHPAPQGDAVIANALHERYVR
ncbi:SGNH/GDSL hydrolase family protein [Nocardia tengchongensis]|uniref:SGNH/GDSL hydrolase family protein n=1 Tax=Nocardia tengchongensis TaxID=2055889 RepID=UPI00364F8F8B